MNEIWTIVWKEWRDALVPRARTEYIRPLLFIALLGVFWPLITGQPWLNVSSAMVLLSVIFPFFFILNYIGDAFAGERERHTLETLLASRISDQAILWGKVIATVGYIWGLAIISSFVGFVAINISKGQGAWTFYSPISDWLAMLIICLLTCLLSASGGILVSLHSATVRQAQQTLLLSSMGLGVALYLVARAIPPEWVLGLSATQLILIAMAVLAVLDAILLAISLASFRRSRLILN